MFSWKWERDGEQEIWEKYIIYSVVNNYCSTVRTRETWSLQSDGKNQDEVVLVPVCN